MDAVGVVVFGGVSEAVLPLLVVPAVRVLGSDRDRVVVTGRLAVPVVSGESEVCGEVV